SNPYWPPELASHVGQLKHEHYVLLLPLALSRTQDDKGRLRWTIFGGSEQGPARGFWRGFFTAPKQEMPAEQALNFFRRLLSTVYGESFDSATEASNGADLRSAGFRILPIEDRPPCAYWREDPWPSWAESFL